MYILRPYLRTKILDFSGVDSSSILSSRGGIPGPVGDFPETLSQRISAWRFLVWRLAAHRVAAPLFFREALPPAPIGRKQAVSDQ